MITRAEAQRSEACQKHFIVILEAEAFKPLAAVMKGVAGKRRAPEGIRMLDGE